MAQRKSERLISARCHGQHVDGAPKRIWPMSFSCDRETREFLSSLPKGTITDYINEAIKEKRKGESEK